MSAMRHGLGYWRRLHNERGHAGKPPCGGGDRHGGGDLIGRVAPRFLQRSAQRRLGVVSRQASLPPGVARLAHGRLTQPGVDRRQQKSRVAA
jgi:hypothetical protein